MRLAIPNMASSSIPNMDWTGEDPAENLSLYKEKLKLYFEDEGITEDAKKSLKILRTIGDQGLKMLHGSGLTDSQKKQEKKLWEFFDTQYPASKVNFRIYRIQLMRLTMSSSESIDHFVTRVRTLGEKCKFTARELEARLMELVITTTPNDDLRKALLGQPETYSNQELLEDGRKYDAIAEGNAQLQKLSSNNKNERKIDALKSRPGKNNCGYCD